MGKTMNKINVVKTPLVLAASMMLGMSVSATVNAEDLASLYAKSVSDASVVQADEITDKLFSLNKSNKDLVWNDDGSKVLVLTWKSQSSYDNYVKPVTATSSSEDYVMWVTLAPQLKRFCTEFVQNTPNITQAQLDLRLKQYLGLHYDWSYDVFAELWVSPEDLFRPCVDPQVNDTTCEMKFGDTIPTVKNIANYKKFYQNLYYNDFRVLPGVPWTGLGYTYDWKDNGTDIGASEYIMTPGASYKIKQSYATAEYCGLK